MQTNHPTVSPPSSPSKHGPRSFPKMTQGQAIALLFILEIYTPPLQPKPAPSRHCHCPDPLSHERSGRSPDERLYATLNFHEAVVLLNNIDKIVTLPPKEKRQLVSLCLDITSVDEKAAGAGGGWRLTTQRPAALSATTWSKCVNLYHLCLIYGSSSIELCVQIANHMRQDGIIIPNPHEPSMPYQFAATEAGGRRSGGRDENVYYRFGKLVWELVYSEDLSDVLSCRACRVLGMDWDWLVAYAKDVRAKEEPETEIDLLDARGDPMGSFRLVKNADGEDEGELEMQLFGPGTNLDEAKVTESRAELRSRLTLDEVKRAEAVAVAAGCPALPTRKPKVPPGNTTGAFKTADAVLKKAEKFQSQIKAWAKCREDERKAEAARERMILGDYMDCGGSRHHGHFPGGALGDIHTNTGKVENLGGEGACANIGGGTKNMEAKRKKATKMAIDVAKQLSEAESRSFLGILDDP